MRRHHPSGRPKHKPKIGTETRVLGQPQGFINSRLETPWCKPKMIGFTFSERRSMAGLAHLEGETVEVIA